MSTSNWYEPGDPYVRVRQPTPVDTRDKLGRLMGDPIPGDPRQKGIAYFLFKHNGLRTDEIAKRLNCTEAEVANGLHRLRERERRNRR